jgi:putative ABC transport system permease protein
MNRLPWLMLLREARFSWKRQLFFAFCVAVGVGGLVAVKSFGLSVEARMRLEARALLAADLVLSSARPFTEAEWKALRGLEARGASISLSREFVSMATVPGKTATRLVDVRAVDARYPFYGRVVTGSGRLFEGLLTEDAAIVHPSVLIYLDLKVGDALLIGGKSFRIVDELIKEPDTVQLFSYAPRVILSDKGGEATGLIREDSLVRYRALVKLPETLPAAQVSEELKKSLPDRFANIRTFDDDQPRVGRFMGLLENYLNLIGLVALILGGVGVAAAIRVFLSQKMDSIAILKCLGATSNQVLGIYAVQAGLLGWIGSLAGAGIGIAVQGVLPLLLADLMPVVLPFAVSWPAVAEGLVLGTFTTLLFTLQPILEVRRVPPARVFRRNVEPEPRRRTFWLTLLALAPLLFLLSLWEGGSLRVGGIFFLGLSASMAVLALAAKGLLALARRLPQPRRFTWKQGLNGLYRPGNQAAAVTLALGLGVMMVLSVYLLQSDLLRQVASGRQGDEPNLIFIDIQDSQRTEFVDTLRRQGIENPELIPVVRGRIRALNGAPVRLDEIQDEEKRRMLSFTFAMTYRDHLVPGEVILKGRFGPDPAISGPQVSVAEWWTDISGTGVGDTLTVDVQGVTLTATITSIRQVDWNNRRANFTLLFMPGALEAAPRMYVSTARLETPAERVALQKAVVARMPNVSAVDVELILQSLQQIVDRIALVIQFMSLFSIGVGFVILGGAIAVTKYQRLRESVLLKTLGATRAAVAAVLSTEYALLGLLAGAVGAIAAGALSWGLVTFVFEGRWDFRFPPYVIATLTAALLTTAVGLAANLDILNRKPMQVLREE